MSVPRIKVCAIQDLYEAQLCVDQGVHTIGFLMLVSAKNSGDYIEPEKAGEIIKCLPDNMNTIMVTHSLDWQKIKIVAEKTGVKAIQIHDNLPLADISKLRDIMPKVTLLKAVHIPYIDASMEAKEVAVNSAKHVAALVDAILLDSRTEKKIGGTGKVHDWDISARIVQEIQKPVILAGGLTPENVAECIRRVKPYGVDVNSGVENIRGAKDPTKVKLYVQNARDALRAYSKS